MVGEGRGQAWVRGDVMQLDHRPIPRPGGGIYCTVMPRRTTTCFRVQTLCFFYSSPSFSLILSRLFCFIISFRSLLLPLPLLSIPVLPPHLNHPLLLVPLFVLSPLPLHLYLFPLLLYLLIKRVSLFFLPFLLLSFFLPLILLLLCLFPLLPPPIPLPASPSPSFY